MARKRKMEKLITDAQAEKYELLSPMLDAILGEVKDLSKKKQDEVLNELKVKMINKVLDQIKELLSDEPTIQFVGLLDDEMLPTNSDTVLILAQFRAAMDIFKGTYYGWDGGVSEHRWFTK